MKFIIEHGSHSGKQQHQSRTGQEWDDGAAEGRDVHGRKGSPKGPPWWPARSPTARLPRSPSPATKVGLPHLLVGHGVLPPVVGLKVQYCDFALKILKIKAENFWKWIQFLEAISYFSSSSLKTPFFCCRQAQAAVKVKFRQEFEIWGEVWWCKTYIVGTMLKIIKLLMPKLEAFFEALDMDPDHGSGEVRRVVMPHGSMKS